MDAATTAYQPGISLKEGAATEMRDGEVCPDETKSVPIGPLLAVRPPNPVPHGQESGSWFPDLACLAIIVAGMRRHLGNFG